MNGNNEAEAKIRKFWEWTPAVKHGTPAFTIDYFDDQIGTMTDINNPSALEFGASILREVLANLKPSHPLWTKLKVVAILMHLATRNQQFSTVYKLLFKLENEIMRRQISWLHKDVEKEINNLVKDNLQHLDLDLSEGWMEQGFEGLNSEVDIKQDPGFEEEMIVKEEVLEEDDNVKYPHDDDVIVNSIQITKDENESDDEVSKDLEWKDPSIKKKKTKKKNSNLKKDRKTTLEQRKKRLENATFNSETKMYTCKFCNKELLGRKIYSHLRIHTQKKPFPCDGCQYSFPTAEALAKHRRKHINKPFCCDLCTQAYETELMLDQHKKRKHEGAKYPYNCNLCDKYFHIKHSLEDHIAVDHSDKPNTYTCDSCGKSFNYKLRYLKHMRLHKAHTNVPRVCDICGKSFKTKTILDAHRKFTHPVQSFNCPECGKILKNENTYKVHMNTHIGIHAKKTISCTFCDKTFTNNRDMTTHVRRNHTGEQPFSCEQCQESFYSEKELRKHINAHIMAHECKVCHKTFGEYDQLARHFLIHTGEKPFTCKLCGKSFRLRPHVIKHVKIHDGAANRRNGSTVATNVPVAIGTVPPTQFYTYTKPRPIDEYVDIKEDL